MFLQSAYSGSEIPATAPELQTVRALGAADLLANFFREEGNNGDHPVA